MAPPSLDRTNNYAVGITIFSRKYN